MAALMVAAGAANASSARRKKLIQLGWDRPDTVWLLKHHEVMEKRPFDGVVIHAVGKKPDGKPMRLRNTCSSDKWEREWFQHCIDNIRACKFQRFTDNLIRIGSNPGNVDWFDDPGWEQVIDHFRIAAWVAKQSGCKGVCWDAEPYWKPHFQFNYGSQAGKDKHSFGEYCAKARQRGREAVAAIAREYPDMLFFTLFMNIINSQSAEAQSPQQALETRSYNLYPAFIDGWLDAAPPTMTFVDGCERAYLFNDVERFLEAAVAIKGSCQNLVSPENRAKYRAQVQIGFGIYLDAHWNPKDSKWGRYFIDGKGGPRVKRLQANVKTALRVCDEYVWIYGEKFRWWPTPNKRVWEQTWPEGLPGCERALRLARDPVDYALTEMARLRKADKLVNLARNGDFGAKSVPASDFPAADWKEGRSPAGWHSWQHKDSKGTFAWDQETGATAKASARAAGVSSSGCFIQSYMVKPGETYAVRAVRKLQGKGMTSIRVRWQTGEGKWVHEMRDKLFFCEADASKDWAEIVGCVEIPDGAGRLVILLGVSGQESKDDVAWYDDVAVHKLDDS